MANSYYDDVDWTLQDFTSPAEKDAMKKAVESEKGVCPKCGKHVGKGIFVHVKGCHGHPIQAA